MKEIMKALTLGVALAVCQGAIAADQVWHWESFGTDSYSGQVDLKDDLGGSVNYQRYNNGSTAQVFGASSVQSPMVILTASSLEVDLVQAGTTVPYPTCTSPETPRIYVTPTTVCHNGTGNNLAGIHAYADDTGSAYVPRLQVWVQGYGWQNIDNHPCGVVEVKTMCK